MATKPTKPSHVNVTALKEVLADLQGIQSTVNEPPPGSFTAVGMEIRSDLGTQVGDNGLTDIAGIDDIDKRYQDNVTVLNQAWPDVKSGIGALIAMLSETISKHSTADTNATDSADRTNTTQAPTSARGLN